MRYLLTGGAGFIGSALARRLVNDGHDVTVLDRMTPTKRARLPWARVVSGDVRDAAVVADAMDECDSVIHLAYKQRASRAGYAGSAEILDVAVRGTAAVLDACDAHRVTDLLLVSSSEVYQPAAEPLSETAPLMVPDTLDMAYAYGCGKIASEMMAAAWAEDGKRLVIARPFNVYGPDMGNEHVIPEFCALMTQLVEEFHGYEVIPFPILGSGQERRAFCYIGDCVGQLMLLLAKGERYSIYNVGDLEEHSVAEVAVKVAQCWDRAIKIIPGSHASSRRVPDTAKIADLGYTPRTGFSEGVAFTVNWYQAHD